MNIQIFAKLPQDTINVILEFFGKIKYKNGEYITIIHKYDFRYALLSTIKLPVTNEYAGIRRILEARDTQRVANQGWSTAGLSSTQVLLKPCELFEISLPQHFEYKIQFNHKHTLRVYNLYTPPDEIVYFFENIIDREYASYKRK
jgi:hypothetical protein